MPLHLLGKKSWNVYSKENIERVRRDEAAAAAREEESERRMQEYDAQRRLAILRGQEPPPPPQEEEIAGPEQAKHQRRDERDSSGFSDRRKRRRLAGEDDTDRDIRLAQEDAATAQAAATKAVVKTSSRGTSDMPLNDYDGHINLFPIDARAARKAEKNAEAEAEKKRKEREYEDQYTMRFSNAAGRGGDIAKAWYTDRATSRADAVSNTEADEGLAMMESKDVWGRADPRRKEREQMRSSTNDPLAFMKKAQKQLKQSEVDRQRWQDQRDREARELESLHKAERRRRKEEDEDEGLDDFSLDRTISRSSNRSERDRYEGHRQQDRHRHRHRHRSRSRSRSRSPSRGSKYKHRDRGDPLRHHDR